MIHSTLRKQEVAAPYAFARQFVDCLPQTFNQEGDEIYTGRNTVKTYNVDGTTLVAKRFKRPNIIQRIAYSFFKPSKAERAYRFAKMIRERGFNTPHEVAFVEMQQHGLILDSYFVSAACMLPPLSKLLRRPDFSHKAATDLALFIVKLHQKGVLHGDLNLTNILYEQDPSGNYLFTLIDTNRSTFCQPNRKQCLQNMLRLSHDRPLLSFVTARYAEARGWNADETVATMMRMLDKFEERLRRKSKIKNAVRNRQASTRP